MSNAISGNIPVWAYSKAARPATAQRTRSNGFLDMLAQTKRAQMDRAGFGGGVSSAAGLTMDLAAVFSSTPGQMNVEGAAAAETVSLESMLKAKYPGLAYHVLDQSTSAWRTRTDYPHYLLYQEGEAAEEKLKNWKPVGANPFYGSIDGRFTAPKELFALGSLPPGSKAVAIHPKVQERMEQDPEYAKEIFARIDTWFAFDVARNEAILPGCTVGMCQSVAIGEDGTIVNAQSSSPPRFTISTSGSDGPDWWERRMKRSKELMELNIAAQIKRAMAYSRYLSAPSIAAGNEKAQLASMLSGGNLREVLGNTIADMPIDDFLTLVGKGIGLMI